MYWGKWEDALTHKPSGVTTVRGFMQVVKRHTPEEIRTFLEWVNLNAHTPQYYDRVIRMVGSLAVTRRQVWMDYLDAILKRNEQRQSEILSLFVKGEQKLFEAIDPFFKGQVKAVSRQVGPEFCVIEFGCGVGQFTAPWMKHVLSLGGQYFAFDQSQAAVDDTRMRLRIEDLGEHQQRVKIGSASDAAYIIKDHCPSAAACIMPIIRLDLHITDDAQWKNFLQTVGRASERVLHAQTSGDLLPPDRICNPGTKYRKEQAVAEALDMVSLSRRVIDHHGDMIAIHDFANPIHM